MQQERAKQRRLEREEQKAWVEAERLTQEIKEAERKQRKLKEAELEQLTLEKERLEEEMHVEQQHVAVLCGSERAAEWRCRLRLAQVGHLLRNLRGPQRRWTEGWGLSSLRKTVCGVLHGSRYVGGTQMDRCGVVDIVNNSKNHVRDSRS